jgi:CHAT domain-containing protein
VTQVAGDHPEPDVLAAFVDGNVEGKALQTVLAHIGICAECQSVVRMAAEFEREEGDQKTPSRGPSFLLLAAAAVLVAAIAGFLLSHADPDPLDVLQREHRLIEARVTDLDHAPFLPARRSSIPQPEREAAMHELRERVQRDRSATNLQRLACGALALGQFREAHQLLTEAIRVGPVSREIFNDLAAAEIGLNRPADAAEISAKILEKSPSFAPALFNYALALEQLSIRETAITAWDDYLRADATSHWAGEARARRNRLAVRPPSWDIDKKLLTSGATPRTIATIVQRHPHQARTYALRELLPQWARGQQPNDLYVLRSIAEARAGAGDLYLRDVVVHASQQRAAERNAILVYGTASESLSERRIEDARVAFNAAASALRQTGSPLARSADILAATMDFYQGRSDEALTKLQRAIASNPYPIVNADAEWIAGLVWSRRDENASLASYRRAIKAARQSGDDEAEAYLTFLCSEIIERVDEAAEADRVRLEALRGLDEINAAPDRFYVALSSSAYASLRAQRPRLATAYIAAQRQFAGTDPLLLAESDTAEALAMRDTGRLAEADRLIRSARLHARRIPTQGLRDRTESNLFLTAGTLALATDPNAAVSSLTAALTISQRYDWHIHTATAFLLRGKAYLATGRQDVAEQDFRAGIAEMERVRNALDEPRLKIAYFERAEELFTKLIELLVAQNRSDEAFTVAERKRSRELLEAVALHSAVETVAVPLEARAVAASIQSPSALIEYALLENQLAIWVVRDGRVALTLADASAVLLESTVRAHAAALAQHDSATTERLGRVLYDNLIAPALPHLVGTRNLIIVGDGILQTVPFAALVSPHGRYLVEDFRLAHSPSASIFDRNSHVGARNPTLLAVAEPGPAGMEFLSSAESEVRALGNIYPRSQVHVGADITPTQFLAASGAASIVHFAGHAILDRRQPELSALVFESSQDNPPALLRASDIAFARLPSRPLVVLAGCSTGRGLLRNSEGVDSLAAAFLRAGARGVVATLWDIDDTTSSPLLQTFHRQLEIGVAPADALRDAQLRLLGSSRSEDRRPEAWAGFILIGTM